MATEDGTYVTVASVRRTSGIGSTEIDDTDVGAIIDEVEPQIERFYNTSFTPKERIEIIDGNGTFRMFLMKNPVLAVRDLYIDGTQEDTANLAIYKGPGMIELNSSATVSTFKLGQQKVVVKYVYGFLEDSTTSSTTSAAEVAGTSVSVSLASITGFADEDWVELIGMDGNREVAQISGSPTGGAIVLDQLVYAHAAGSTVTKLQIMQVITKIMNICCALAMVARIVGQSYTDIVGYDLGELHVQKGEPYTQWRETAAQLIKERDMLMAKIKARPAVM